jgi:hypothetical protein
MSCKKLLQSNSAHRHTASRQERSDIRRLVARDLADAANPGALRRSPLCDCLQRLASDGEDGYRVCWIQNRKRARPSSLDILKETNCRSASKPNNWLITLTPAAANETKLITPARQSPPQPRQTNSSSTRNHFSKWWKNGSRQLTLR